MPAYPVEALTASAYPIGGTMVSTPSAGAMSAMTAPSGARTCPSMMDSGVSSGGGRRRVTSLGAPPAKTPAQ